LGFFVAKIETPGPAPVGAALGRLASAVEKNAAETLPAADAPRICR
jgi:hypothetical protein